jgi:hypothetical protein
MLIEYITYKQLSNSVSASLMFDTSLLYGQYFLTDMRSTFLPYLFMSLMHLFLQENVFEIVVHCGTNGGEEERV